MAALLQQVRVLEAWDTPDRVADGLKARERRLAFEVKQSTRGGFNWDIGDIWLPDETASGKRRNVEEWRQAVIVVRFKVGDSDREFRFDAERATKSDTTPILLSTIADGRTYWFYQRRPFVANDDRLTAEDVKALVNETENKRRLRLEKAHALQAMREQVDQRGKRQALPQDVKVTVWQRDGGRCVECAQNEHLEFDHIIPLAMGGSNTVRNLQLLCADCNRRKGATLG